MKYLDCHVTASLTPIHSDIEHIWQTTWRIGFYRGGPVFMSALAGIDIALWDLKGAELFQNALIILIAHSKKTRSSNLPSARW